MDVETPTKKTSNTLGVPVAIVLAGVIMASALYFRAPNSGNNKPATSTPPQVAGEQMAIVDVKVDDDDPVLGADTAPVTIIEFSDFECPYCKQFHTTTFLKIKETYIDTGKVKYVYKDFPLSQIHPQAQLAAEAGQCAHEQGKFWQYADVLFQRQSALAKDNLKQYATELGLNATQFGECVDSGKNQAEVATDQQAGISAQVAGTPAFAINGQRIDGALPWENFKTVIDQALSGSNAGNN